jgi:oxalate decarboxylase/phosphoglucose isomerase-like protein (cupin superfamily)
VIKRHTEDESGAPELYVVMSGHATFTVGEDEIDAPAGTCVFVRDAALERVAFAKQDGTVVLSIGAAAEGKAFSPAGWDTSYLEAS